MALSVLLQVCLQVGQGVGGELHTLGGDLRQQSQQPQGHCSGAGAQVHPRRRREALEAAGQLLHQDDGVLTGAEDSLSHREGEPQKVPLAQNVLERSPGGSLLHRLEEGGLLFRGGGLLPVDGQARAVQSQEVLGKQGSIPAGGVDARLGEPLPGGEVQLTAGHRIRSSPFSGMTASMAVMAASIILSSGSLTVSRCIQSPGATSARVKALSWRAQAFCSS